MSEVNTTPNATPEEQVRTIQRTVTRASVIVMPIDPNLQNQGEAADAYATGQAIAAVLTGAKVNEKSFDPETKKITLYGGDIKMDDTDGAKTLKTAIDDIDDKTANEILFDSQSTQTVKQKVNAINTDLGTDFSQEEVDELIDEILDEMEDDE